MSDLLRRRAAVARRLGGLLIVPWVSGCEQAHVAEPRALWLLWLAPALGLLLYLAGRRRRLLLERFAASPMLARLGATDGSGRRRLKAVLVVFGFGAGLLAMAGIEVGFEWETIERRGVDLVVALDVSDSMLVRDAGADELSRLERARREISDLLAMLQGDRIALVAFAGTAFVELPLTLDYNAARLFLDSLEPDLIPVKGTDLAAALRTATDAFDDQGGGERAVLLITDGEDHSGAALKAAEEAAAKGVRVFAIGVGREEGAPIPRAGGGFRRDSRGEIILSRLEESPLQRIALTTGGRYVRSMTADLDLVEIYIEGIKSVLADTELESSRRQRWYDRFQWFLALAIAALMLEPLISESSRPGRTSHV